MGDRLNVVTVLRALPEISQRCIALGFPNNSNPDEREDLA